MAAGQARVDALALDLAAAQASQTRALAHCQQIEEQLASVVSELLEHTKDSSSKCLEVDAWDGHNAEAHDQEPPELPDPAGELKQESVESVREPASACRKASKEREASRRMKRQFRSSNRSQQLGEAAATPRKVQTTDSDGGSSSSGSDFEVRRRGHGRDEGSRSSDQNLMASKDVAAEAAWVAREGADISKKQVELDDLRQTINTNALKVCSFDFSKGNQETF